MATADISPVVSSVPLLVVDVIWRFQCTLCSLQEVLVSYGQSYWDHSHERSTAPAPSHGFPADRVYSSLMVWDDVPVACLRAISQSMTPLHIRAGRTRTGQSRVGG